MHLYNFNTDRKYIWKNGLSSFKKHLECNIVAPILAEYLSNKDGSMKNAKYNCAPSVSFSCDILVFQF